MAHATCIFNKIKRISGRDDGMPGFGAVTSFAVLLSDLSVTKVPVPYLPVFAYDEAVLVLE